MRSPILTIGKYEVTDLIATGGMAAVYRARIAGPMGFEKPVVIKLLLDEAANDREIVSMFIAEARLGAKLSHPNIAAILDFGEADGRYFIAMEYVDGVSLWELLKNLKGKALEEKAVIFIAQNVLRALSYAHSLKDENGRLVGIVHRDVSPHNILLDRSGTVKLCDFGIATGGHRDEKTKTGIVKGKVAYMSPEQAAAEPLDGRSDLFSLAVTMYVALGGKLEGRSSPLSPEATKDLSCSEALKDLLKRALAHKKEERFQSAEEFLQAISDQGLDPGEPGRQHLIQTLKSVPILKAKGKIKHPEAPERETKTDSYISYRNLLFVVLAFLILAFIMALFGVRLLDTESLSTTKDTTSSAETQIMSP